MVAATLGRYFGSRSIDSRQSTEHAGRDCRLCSKVGIFPRGLRTPQWNERMSGRVDITHVPKPWGHETIWARTDAYAGKILHIKAGHSLSVQYHNVKDETVYLLSGRLIYRIWPQGKDGAPADVNLQIGQAYRITPHTIH